MIKRLALILCGISVLMLLVPNPTNAIERGWGKSIGVSKVHVPGTSENQEDNLLHTIRVATNRVLGMLSFAALMLCLYAGFQMMISGGDSKKYTAGLSILKNAGIGLAIIGVSWLIVSLIFYVINNSIQLKGG